MKSDEFDAFFRVKLDELNQVPDVAWNNESAWSKVISKMGKGFGGLKVFTAVVLLISVACILFVWNYKYAKQPVTALVETNIIPAKSLQTHLPKQTDTLEWKNFIMVSRLERPKVKIEKQVNSIGIRHLLMTAPVFTTHPTQESLPEVTTTNSEQKELANDSIIGYSKLTEPVKNKISIEKELYVSVQGNTTTTGTHYVAALTNKFSLLTGLQFAKSYNPYFNLEHIYAPLAAYSIQVPLQIRYYLLPRENRLTAFIYSGISASVPVGGFTQPGSALRIETGGEVRYWIYADKYKNAAYFFIRLPVHNKDILNYRNNNY
jgi:hypothetical protein